MDVKKNFDETEYVDNFEFAFKDHKNDFDCEKDILAEIVMLSNSEDSTSKNYIIKSDKNKVQYNRVDLPLYFFDRKIVINVNIL